MEFFPAVKLQNSHTDQTHGDGQAAEIPHFWRPAFNFERTYFLFFFLPPRQREKNKQFVIVKNTSCRVCAAGLTNSTAAACLSAAPAGTSSRLNGLIAITAAARLEYYTV